MTGQFTPQQVAAADQLQAIAHEAAVIAGQLPGPDSLQPSMVFFVEEFERVATDPRGRGRPGTLQTCGHSTVRRPVLTFWTPSRPLVLACRPCWSAWGHAAPQVPCDICTGGVGQLAPVLRAFGPTLVVAFVCSQCAIATGPPQ